jgi:hypothetical protein
MRAIEKMNVVSLKKDPVYRRGKSMGKYLAACSVLTEAVSSSQQRPTEVFPEACDIQQGA